MQGPLVLNFNTDHNYTLNFLGSTRSIDGLLSDDCMHVCMGLLSIQLNYVVVSGQFFSA